MVIADQWLFFFPFPDYFRLFQHVGVTIDGGSDFLYRFGHGALKLSTAGILVSTAVEETRCHLVAREIAHAAQTESHAARMFCILINKDTEAYAKHCQGNIDNTLCVAVLRW